MLKLLEKLMRVTLSSVLIALLTPLLFAILAWAVPPPLIAQEMPAAVVHYTEARAFELRGQVRLPGTVEAAT